MAGSDVELLMRIPASPSLAFAAAGKSHPLTSMGLDLEPLFKVGQSSISGGGFSVGESDTASEWYVARAKGASRENLWDVAHEAIDKLSRKRGLTAQARPDIVEPNLQQQWIIGESENPKVLGASEEACSFNDQDKSLPRLIGQFAWHLGDSFSQLAAARETAKLQTGSNAIRIAHLDTGYDKKHSIFSSVNINRSLERNFVDDDRPKDAADLGVDGLLKNPGHGTGTLSILSGGLFEINKHGYSFKDMLGGAPEAEIVPVRVGNSVVQLTTKDIASGINYAVDVKVNVISMSMGGVASAAWADAVNKAYEAGIVFVAAAGNNFSTGSFGFPTRKIVYPARFRRVVAACGVMGNRQPYYDLDQGQMQGNWGPEGAMATALSAYTPNVPWAQWGCPEIVRMDGAGTSSATPQIAAAVALYLQLYRKTLIESADYQGWKRVEAVRQALFRSADRTADGGSREKLGNGLLRANHALAIKPIPSQMLQKTALDSAGFPFLNVLSRRGLVPSQEDAMLQLEATQLSQRSDSRKELNDLEEAISDPDRKSEDVPHQEVERFLEAVLAHRYASTRLKTRAKEVLDMITVKSRHKTKPATRKVYDEAGQGGLRAQPKAIADVERKSTVKVPAPPFRKLRTYAVDPSLSAQLDTVKISEVTLKLPWEELKPGPSGEYVEVIDVDPPSKLFYEPVDLNDPFILAQDGLAPSEGVPQFHQQMTYAVTSLTIKNFERALGRKALWRAVRDRKSANPFDDSVFVQKLRIYPHALREANAYYSPAKVALLFGYFDSVNINDGKMIPGSRVFSCLSHDIIAHETTHALLDGMHRQFLLPSNRDVHAFHEGFADCVAMLQHFTFPDLVAHQILSTGGKIDSQENILVQLAGQFGVATKRRSSLRDAIGVDEDGVWKLKEPDPAEYETVNESHARGRILVSAVFDAFLSMYRRRTADLLRLASGGSGILPQGSIHPDLANRLAAEATRSAEHALTMCIRALDYCPPTDITFGEYLRAIITADYEVVKDDRFEYRVSFIEAFRRRGIFPPGVQALSVGNLKWRSVDEQKQQPSKQLDALIASRRHYTEKVLYAESRQKVFFLERAMRIEFHKELKRHFDDKDDDAVNDGQFLGLDLERSFEVHTARVAFRPHPDGGISPQLLIGLLQSQKRPVNQNDPDGDQMDFEGGCVLIADLYSGKLQYCIRKSILAPTSLEHQDTRLAQQQAFAMREFDSLLSTYQNQRPLNANRNSDRLEPFALIHREP